MLTELRRELLFAWREVAFRWTVLLALGFSVFSLLVGTFEINQQNEELTKLLADTIQERELVITGKTDPGDLAYAAFHLTYDPPSSFGFAALGSRDELTWKHRVRMLALEGQIHETDTGNPELAVLGQLDFAYLVSVLMPLFVIGLLFDIDARERREARYELVCLTSIFGANLFLIRALVRALVLFCAFAFPFSIAVAVNGATITTGLIALGVLSLHMFFWVLVCRSITAREVDGMTAALSLFSIWILLAIVVPVVGKAGVDRAISVPNGGDILLTQREVVNGAWDLPKTVTMTSFLKIHSEWRDYVGIDKPFEWKWYYAFQEVGDRAALPISTALYEGMAARDASMGLVALLSPTLLAERSLTFLAQSGVSQHLRYVRCVREFHANLRLFYYSGLFNQQTYSAEKMTQLPRYSPCVD